MAWLKKWIRSRELQRITQSDNAVVWVQIVDHGEVQVERCDWLVKLCRGGVSVWGSSKE